MDIHTLQHLAAQGFIPGPLENETDYQQRVSYCLQLQNELGFEAVSEKLLEKSLACTHSLFGIKPSWIPLNFSNYQLPLWVGGCAWIFQNTENTPTGAFIQLRKKLKTASSYCFYHRNELLSHELSHIGRMMFDEPRYEEIFAYKTSPLTFRKFLGPMFAEGWQMMTFMILTVFIFLVDLCALWWGGWESYLAFFPLKLIPLGWSVWMLGTLAIKQLKINRLEKIYSLQFLYGLTDKEIDAFSDMTTAQVLEYAQQQTCLRWKYLDTLFVNVHLGEQLPLFNLRNLD